MYGMGMAKLRGIGCAIGAPVSLLSTPRSPTLYTLTSLTRYHVRDCRLDFVDGSLSVLCDKLGPMYTQTRQPDLIAA